MLHSFDHSSYVQNTFLIVEKLPSPRTEGQARPGLEARLGGVVAAVGADGVDGVRIDLHLRIIVAAGQEPHLDCPQMQTQPVEEDARIK